MCRRCLPSPTPQPLCPEPQSAPLPLLLLQTGGALGPWGLCSASSVWGAPVGSSVTSPAAPRAPGGPALHPAAWAQKPAWGPGAWARGWAPRTARQGGPRHDAPLQSWRGPFCDSRQGVLPPPSRPPPLQPRRHAARGWASYADRVPSDSVR